MNFGLQKKLTFFIIILLFIFIPLTSVVNTCFQEKCIHKEMHEKAISLSSLLRLSATNPLDMLRMDQLRMLLSDVLDQQDVIYAYVFDGDGRIISDGTEENKRRDEILGDAVSQKAVGSDVRLLQHTHNGLDITNPIFLGDDKIGGVRIGFSEEQMKIDMRAARNRNLLLGLVVVFIGVVFAHILAGTIVKPISKLAEGADLVGKGDFSLKVQVKSKDELGKLADSFNQMAANLKRTTASRDEVNAVNQQLAVNEQSLIAANKQLKENEKSLNEKFAEIDRQNRLMMGREKKVIEMKKEVNDLLTELGREKKYQQWNPVSNSLFRSAGF